MTEMQAFFSSTVINKQSVSGDSVVQLEMIAQCTPDKIGMLATGRVFSLRIDHIFFRRFDSIQHAENSCWWTDIILKPDSAEYRAFDFRRQKHQIKIAHCF